MSVWRGKVWRMDGFSHKVIIISKNLDGFSLANHGRFAKFAKLSPRQTFPLYGIYHIYQLDDTTAIKFIKQQ